MTNIRKYKISSSTIAADGSASAYSSPIRGRILAVGVDYPAHSCTVDLDTDGEASAQKILDLGAATTDKTFYPRVQVEDNTGTGVNYASGYPIYEPYVVYGRIKLTVASGTAGEKVSVYIVVEED